MAAHQKKARELHGTLVFTDESGFLLAPLTKRTLAPIGRTPLLRHRARHRDKISAVAALTLSPSAGRLGLHARTFTDAYVDAEVYAFFLRQLLHHLRGPLILLHDNGKMHHGPLVERVRNDFPRLHVHPFPPYTPEFNPTEYLWNWCKDKKLANYAPHDVPELDRAACACLEDARHDQQRLRSFFESSPLSWEGTGLI